MHALGADGLAALWNRVRSLVPAKVSELENDAGYISEVPAEYVTEAKLDAKGYLTEHQDLSSYALKTELPTVPTKVSAFTNDSGYLTKSTLLNLVYPVGSIYMSVNSTSPQSFLGGTWQKLENRFLLGAGSSYSAGSTGGAATHTLTEREVPDISITSANGQIYTDYLVASGGTTIRNFGTVQASAWANPIYANGGGQAHNNMPPYLAVYMWKRTA